MSRAKSSSSSGANRVKREVGPGSSGAAAVVRSWYWRSEVVMALVKSV